MAAGVSGRAVNMSISIRSALVDAGRSGSENSDVMVGRTKRTSLSTRAGKSKYARAAPWSRSGSPEKSPAASLVIRLRRMRWASNASAQCCAVQHSCGSGWKQGSVSMRHRRRYAAHQRASRSALVRRNAFRGTVIESRILSLQSMESQVVIRKSKPRLRRNVQPGVEPPQLLPERGRRRWSPRACVRCVDGMVRGVAPAPPYRCRDC